MNTATDQPSNSLPEGATTFEISSKVCRMNIPMRKKIFGLRTFILRLCHVQSSLLKIRSSYCLAGAAGLEPTTYGFGDRCATNCARPLGVHIHRTQSMGLP